MGFGKAFGVGIAVFLGFAVLTSIISLLFLGIDAEDLLGPLSAYFSGIGDDIAGSILGLLSGLCFLLGMPFYLAGTPLGTSAAGIALNIEVGLLFSGLAVIIGIALMFVVAIIVGYLSHNPTAAFGAMFLIAIIGAVIAVLANLFSLIALYASLSLTFTLTLNDIIDLIISIVIPGVVNGLAFGAVAMGVGIRYEE